MGRGRGAADAAAPGRGSRRGTADPPRWPPFGPRGPPSTRHTGGTGTHRGGPGPPPVPAGGGKGPLSTGRRPTGPAGPGWGWPPPRRSARGATFLWRRPTLGNPTGRGPCPRAPHCSGGTRRWPARRGPTPGPPSTWPRPRARAAATSPTPWRPPAAPRGRPGHPPHRPAHRR